jgi:exodeoxyribonuclease VIII
MSNVMIDLETRSTHGNAVILSIGAVKFTDTEILDTFYVVLDSDQGIDMGLHVDAATDQWWKEQGPEARAAVFDAPKTDYKEGLFLLNEWYKTDLPTWGNSAVFDNVILRNSFAAFGVRCPWTYRNDRCYRTVRHEHGNIDFPTFVGTKHNALDDALAQVKHLQLIRAYQATLIDPNAPVTTEAP